MVGLVTSKNGDSIKSEGAGVATIFSPLSVYEKIFVAQGQVTQKQKVLSGPKSNSSRDVLVVLVTSKKAEQ